MKSKLYVITLFVLLALFANINYGQAEQFNLDNIPKIEPMELMPQGEFEEKTKPIVHNSEADKSLAYTARLPAGWEESKVYSLMSDETSSLGEKVLGTISRFVSPPRVVEARSFFSVDALKLTYEIGVKSWFINYVLINGLSLERMTVKNKRELEAIYVEVRKDTAYIVRVRAIINGSKMVVARYYVPQNLFKEEKVMQAQAIKSFKLTFPDDSAIEDLKTFGFLSQSYFDYPPSWTLEASNITSIDRMRALLHRNVKRGKLEGQIDIRLTNKLSVSSRSKIIKEFREEFSIDKYNVGKRIEKPEVEYNKDMSFGMTEVYELNPTTANMVKYELWVSVMEGEDYYYLTSLITPARQEGFYEWAKNVETYKLVVNRLRRHDSRRSVFEFVQ